MKTTQKLYRSKTEKVIGGVAGGLGDYLDIDAVIVRIIFILLAIFGGSGVLVYIILWIAIPAQVIVFTNEGTNPADVPNQSNEMSEMPSQKKSNTGLVAGIIMVALGSLFLISELVPIFHFWNFWPILLIVAGVLIIKPELVKSSK